jgi:hypothetical protein
MNECVIRQVLMIALARLAHFNNLLSEHFTRHCGFVVRNEGAARSSQHIPRGIECRCQYFGFFGTQRCGLEISQYRHCRAHSRLRRTKNNNTQQEVLANDFVYFLMSEKHEFLYLKLENSYFRSREARPKPQFFFRIENAHASACYQSRIEKAFKKF